MEVSILTHTENCTLGITVFGAYYEIIGLIILHLIQTSIPKKEIFLLL